MNISGSTLTVGIPIYSGNKPAELRQSIHSVINQRLMPDELHLVQDGPIGVELASVISEFSNSSVLLKHLVIPENSGLSNALNISILNTSSEFYARMDADDISHPDRFQKQVTYLNDHPEVEILGTWVKEFENDYLGELGFVKKLPITQTDIHSFFHYRNPLAHPTVMFRRGVFAQIGLYDISFRSDGDLELWGRALNHGVIIHNLPEILLYYRSTGAMFRRAQFDMIIQQFRARYRYNTLSPKLNLLKFFSIAFRILPKSLQMWGYQNLR